MREPIYVLAVPHGGSSVVAGILDHLGCDMGRWKPRPSTYDSYEDVDARQFAIGNDRATPQMAEGFRRYVEKREREAEGLWGVKVFAHRLLLAYPDLQRSFRFVRVVRPLEDTIRADDRELGDRFGPRADRAAHLAMRWQEARSLADAVRGRIDFYISYDAVRRSPGTAVRAINEDLDLGASDEQIQAAIKFVRPAE